MNKKKWYINILLIMVLLLIIYYVCAPMYPPKPIVIMSKELHIVRVLEEYLSTHDSFPNKDVFLKILPSKSVNILKSNSITLFYSPNEISDDDNNKWHLVFLHKKTNIITAFKVYPENLDKSNKPLHEQKNIDYTDYPQWILKYKSDEIF